MPVVLRCFRAALVTACACAACAAFADADTTTPEPPPKGTPDVAPEPKWEGAVGPMFSLAPDYSGSAHMKLSVTPGIYLRKGRFSISNQSGFVTRRSDDVFRGLALDMVNTGNVRVNFALRLDNGRRSADSAGLTGIQNVRRTIRMRSSVTWQLEHGWKAGGGWNMDLLGRGGGNVLDVGVGHDRRISPRTVWNIGAGVTWADSRYMRSWYGVTPDESTASGRPVYEPGSGMRDMNMGTGFRMEINPRWTALWGGSVSRLLGPAAASPLTTSARQWSLNGGVGWRF
jgi:outer membrane scaffolding protein for murein synthesis (MipA/OmpV family)